MSPYLGNALTPNSKDIVEFIASNVLYYFAEVTVFGVIAFTLNRKNRNEFSLIPVRPCRSFASSDVVGRRFVGRFARSLTCRSLEALSLINPYRNGVTALVSFVASLFPPAPRARLAAVCCLLLLYFLNSSPYHLLA